MSSNTENIETSSESNGPDRDAESATLYLRSGAGGTVERRQAELRERFEAVREEVDAVGMRLERWSRTVVTPTGDDRSAAAVSTYRDLSEAVDAAGGRLQPFFEVRERRGGMLVGRPDGRRITFPVACLVVRSDRTPVGCYPCWLDGTHFSVEDGLAALASGEPANLH
jgi:hypothetical protein